MKSRCPRTEASCPHDQLSPSPDNMIKQVLNMSGADILAEIGKIERNPEAYVENVKARLLRLIADREK